MRPTRRFARSGIFVAAGALATIGFAATPTAYADPAPDTDHPVGLSIAATPQDTDDSGATDSGDRIAYVVTVSNDGDETLTDVAVELDRNLHGAACAATTLAPGASTTCRPELSDYVFVTDARAGRAPLPGRPDVVEKAGMSVTLDRTLDGAMTLTDKTTTEDVDGDGTIGEGDEITFRFNARTVGRRTLTGTRVGADDVSGFSCVKRTLEPGQVTGCTADPYVIQWGDADLGGMTVFARGYANAGTAGTAWATQYASVTITRPGR